MIARARSADAKAEKGTVEAARAGLDARSPSHAGLRALAESLDALEARLDTLDELAGLDRRHADLAAWASSARRTKRLEAVKVAARAAKADNAGAAALATYERTLDQLSVDLGERAGVAGGAGTVQLADSKGTCQEGDPGCGLDGKPVF